MLRELAGDGEYPPCITYGCDGVPFYGYLWEDMFGDWLRLLSEKARPGALIWVPGFVLDNIKTANEVLADANTNMRMLCEHKSGELYQVK